MTAPNQYVLGIDVGTTGTKSVIFDEHGNIISRGYVEYEVNLPQQGWAEQDPSTWWEAVAKSVRSSMNGCSARTGNIAAIGLSGQTNGIVPLDKSGNVLHPCIIWLDRRAAPQADRIRQEIGDQRFHMVTGVRIDPFYSVFKLLWFKENEPARFEKTAAFLQPKDYIGFRLSGELFVDVGLASCMGVMDVSKIRYAESLLEELKLPLAKLPKLVHASEIVGELTDDASKTLGLKKGTPVVAGSGDVMVNAVGTGAIDPGLAYSKTATASDVVVCVDRPVLDKGCRMATYVSAVENRWNLIGGSSGGGICYRWFRDNFGQTEVQIARNLQRDPYEILNSEAELAPPGSNKLIFLPYLAGARSPIWDPYARGIFFGMSLEHEKRHFVRSIMEGVAYSMRHRIAIMEKEVGVQIGEIRAVGGGARSRLWRQIMADICGKVIVSLTGGEHECLGASILAGVGARIHPNIQSAVRQMVSTESRILPNQSLYEVYTGLFNIYVNLYDCLKQSYKETSELPTVS